jgi:hypothetical protein
MAKSPTAAQRHFAEQLGIDIPAGISRAGLADLIDFTLRRQRAEKAGLNHLPNEIAMGVVQRKYPATSEANCKAAIDWLAENNIREGSVVELGSSIHNPCVVRPFGLGPSWQLQSLADGYHTDYIPVGYLYGTIFRPTLQIKLLFCPPEGHSHRLCVRLGETFRAKVDQKLRDYISKCLGPHECVQTSYGEYWSKSAVKRLTKEFTDQENQKLIERENRRLNRPRKTATVLRPKHCIQCGTRHEPQGTPEYWGKWRRCDACRSAPSPKHSTHRFCTYCGIPFALEPGSRSNNTVSTCREHRVGCT